MSLSVNITQADLEVLTENMPVGVLVHRKGVIHFANQALLQMLGYQDRVELEGRSAQDLVCPEERGVVLERIRANGEGKISPPLEEHLLRKDGSIAYVEVSGVPVTCAGEPATMALFKDVSQSRSAAEDVVESKKRQADLEQRLRQAQKMEAIGQLAGGVAHDFNNILMIINMNCQLMIEERGEKRGGPYDRLEEVLSAGESAAELTRQLLTFSRRQEPERIHFDLNQQVSSTQRMLLRLLREDISLTVNLQPGLGWIDADPSQIEQVLLNLSVNARDAMPNGGALSINTSSDLVEAGPRAAWLDLAPGAYVKLSVQDSGHGMTKEVMEHIFEPFFTTKELGKGTGMGLASVYGIVMQSKAAIRVESISGLGARFDIYFPRVEPGISETGQIAPLGELRGGHERILVVEDESHLRETLCTALRDKGYEVFEASSGSEALQMAAEAALPFDAMISDLIMPGMDGLRLAAQMRQEHSLERILLMSGYSYPVVSTLAGDLPRENLLQKPMSLAKMLGRLRELLDP